MRLHDWTRVEAGAFHGFHQAWCIFLREQLNNGLLPRGYFADSEQVVRPIEADVLTLNVQPTLFEPASDHGGVALAEAPPRTRRSVEVVLGVTDRPRHRRVAIRHVSGHRVVAVIEIVSPANKDRADSVDGFVQKIVGILREGVHVMIVDVFAPGRYDPEGLSGAVLAELIATSDEEVESAPLAPPKGEPLTFASFAAGRKVRAFLEYRAVGAELPEMPLFLTGERYVNVPLADTYARAWNGTPYVYREILEPAVDRNGA